MRCFIKCINASLIIRQNDEDDAHQLWERNAGKFFSKKRRAKAKRFSEIWSFLCFFLCRGFRNFSFLHFSSPEKHLWSYDKGQKPFKNSFWLHKKNPEGKVRRRIGGERENFFHISVQTIEVGALLVMLAVCCFSLLSHPTNRNSYHAVEM